MKSFKTLMLTGLLGLGSITSNTSECGAQDSVALISNCVGACLLVSGAIILSPLVLFPYGLSKVVQESPKLEHKIFAGTLLAAYLGGLGYFAYRSLQKEHKKK